MHILVHRPQSSRVSLALIYHSACLKVDAETLLSDCSQNSLEGEVSQSFDAKYYDLKVHNVADKMHRAV